MPNARADHPSAEALWRFGRGELFGLEADAVEGHLAACPDCCRTACAVADDPLVELVRLAGRRTGFADEAGPPTGEADQTVDDPPPPLRDHPRYRVLGVLGRGGMGAVFLAEHRVMQRLVALKVLGQDLTGRPELAERFRREARAAAQLDHPHIVRAHDADQAEAAHFLVMEYIRGTDLARLLAARGPLPVGEACAYARQAALGLQHAHEHGMVHRDIKPSNLMRTEHGTIKVLDFGVACFASEAAAPAALPEEDQEEARATGTGLLLGTADYMAPEQAADPRRADVRSDLYGLGCTLYHLLAGRPPFPGGTPREKVRSHAEREPTPIRELCPEVPPALAAVVARMMAKEPAQRCRTLADAADALAPFADLSHEEAGAGRAVATAEDGVTAAVSPSASALRRRRGRRRLVLVVALAVLAALTALAIYQTRPEDTGPAPRTAPRAAQIPAGPVDHPPGEVWRVKIGGRSIEMPALSPDGRYCAVATPRGGNGGVYDLGTREKVFPFQTISLAAFTADGKHLIANVEHDGFALVFYRMPDGKPVRTFPVRKAFGIWGLAAAPDGKRVLAAWGGSGPGMVVLDARTGQEALQRQGWGLFSLGGKVLLGCAPGANKLEVIDLEKGNRVGTLPGGGGPHREPALVSGGALLFRCYAATGQAQAWDVRTGKQVGVIALGPTWIGGQGYCTASAASSADGRRLLTAHDDGFVRLWDVAAGKEVYRFPVSAAVIHGLTFSGDGRYAAGGTPNGWLYVWRLPGPGAPPLEPAPPFITHPDGTREHVWNRWIYRSAFSPDGRFYLVTGDWPGKQIRIWETATGKLVRVLPGGGWADFMPDGKHLLANDEARDMRLWDLATGREVRRFACHSTRGGRFWVSANGKRVLSWDMDGTVRFWDVATAQECWRVPAGFRWDDLPAALSPDGRLALVRDSGGALHLYDIDGRREVRGWRLPGNELPLVLQFLPQGRRCVVVSRRSIRWYGVDGGEESKPLPYDPTDANGAAWGLSRDARHLMLIPKDYRTVRVLELSTGRESACFRLPDPALAAPASWPFGIPALAADGRHLLVTALNSATVSARVYLYPLPPTAPSP